MLFSLIENSSATPSNYIVKNSITGTKGYVKFARETDILIGTNRYKNNSIYNINVSDAAEILKFFM